MAHMPEPRYVSGQAAMEGVMMRGASTWAVSVRTPEGAIRTEKPGLALQRMTTREPSLDQLEVAIASLKAVLSAAELEAVEARTA
jgi:uncharacterized protein YqhQ